MQKIIAIAFKDTVIRFSSWTEWLFFVILPVAFTVILAGGTGGAGDSRVRTIVVDQAGSPLAQELITILHESNAVRLEVMSLRDAENEFSRRRSPAILIIPAGFSLERVAQGEIEVDVRQRPNDPNALIAYREAAVHNPDIPQGLSCE